MAPPNRSQRLRPAHSHCGPRGVELGPSLVSECPNQSPLRRWIPGCGDDPGWWQPASIGLPDGRSVCRICR
eukprot:6298918-Pyramimonas_sp.AAC.1